MAYLRKLEGKKVYLSPIDLADAPRYAEWLNDLEVSKHLTLASASITIEKERGILGRLAEDHTYSIVDAATDELVGNIGLKEIGRRRKARYMNGVFHDILFMDLLAEDFGPTRIPALDVPGSAGV